MNFEEAVKETGEVRKRREALGAIIDVDRFRNELLISMLKVGAVLGGGAFLVGLFVMYADGRVSFPVVVALSLVMFIGSAFTYLGVNGLETELEREIRRRMRERR